MTAQRSVVVSLAILASVSTVQGAFSQARRTTYDDAQTAAADALLAQVNELRDQARYAAAIPLATQLAALHKELFGANSETYADSLNELAVLHYWLGQYDQAEPLYLDALAIKRELPAPTDLSTILNNLAELYRTLGRYAKAEPLYREAMEEVKRLQGQENADYVLCLNNLGLLYSDMGDYVRAEPLFVESLSIRKQLFGENNAEYAAGLNNLAELYRATGDYDRAEPLYLRAIEIDRAVLGEDHPGLAIDLTNLASLYHARGDAARAETLYLQALTIKAKALGEQHPSYALTLSHLAALYRGTGDTERAEPLYLKSLKIRRDVYGETHPEYARGLSDLGLLYDATGDHERAQAQLRRALEIATQLADAMAVVQDEDGQLRHRASAQMYLDYYVGCLVHTPDRADVAYQAVLNWKGATLTRQRAARLAAGAPELAPRLAELQAIVKKWSALALMPRAAVADRDGQLQELARRKEQLEAELFAVDRSGLADVSPESIRDALPEDAALVDFVEGWHQHRDPRGSRVLTWRRSLIAFVIRPGRGLVILEIGDAPTISQAIDRWRAGHGESADAQLAGASLRGQLWEPLTPFLGDAKLILISPDGALGKLPFGALPGRVPGTFLIEDVALTLIPVPQLIPALQAAPTPPALPRELLVLGGVDYDRRAEPEITIAARGPQRPWERQAFSPAERAPTDGQTWSFLRGTDTEATYIAGLYRRLMELPAGTERIVHLRGAEASEAALSAAAPQCYLLHLATHGFFAAEEERPSDFDSPDRSVLGDRRDEVGRLSPGLLSGLVLSGANHPPAEDSEQELSLDDGILTASEIAVMPLTGAQLVVLSACETGLGEVAGGEGLLGIQRAFQVAGARTTIATLWKVSDEATRQIMEEFYRNYLEKKMSPGDALRAAQIWALNKPLLSPRGADAPATNAAPTRLSPRFWAAFTLAGDWQ